MNNLNPYNENQFKHTFKHTKIYKKLTLDFDENDLIWDKFFVLSPVIQNRANNNRLKKSQPRLPGETPRAVFPNNFSVSIFYYLMPLIEHEYTTIYDLGCGKNMFKPYLPNLLGVGAEASIAEKTFIKSYNNVKAIGWPNISSRAEFKKLPSWIQDECIDQHHLDLNLYLYDHHEFYGDIDGYVDDEYVAEHQNYFESVFSICALHYHPIDQFCKVVENFSSMVRAHGRGFISINLQRMVDSSSAEMLISLFGNVHPTQVLLDKYIRRELNKINLEWLIVDVDLLLVDEGINGNIRLVFKK